MTEPVKKRLKFGELFNQAHQRILSKSLYTQLHVRGIGNTIIDSAIISPSRYQWRD